MDYFRTDGNHKDFINNCRMLDEDLERIKHAIVIYDGTVPIGGGAIREFDDQNVELKHAHYIKSSDLM